MCAMQAIRESKQEREQEQENWTEHNNRCCTQPFINSASPAIQRQYIHLFLDAFRAVLLYEQA